MERQNKNYSNQQSKAAFQPQTYRQSSSERVNPGRTEMHSSSIPSNGDSTRVSIYKMKARDTLWGISEVKMGSGSRWTELQKKDGSAFTEQEARRLPVGTLVYLPESKSANSFQLAPEIRVQLSDSGANLNKMVLGKVGNGDRGIPSKLPGSYISPAGFYEASQGSSPQFRAEGISSRRLADGSPFRQGSTQPSDASHNQNLLGLSDDQYLAQHIAGNAAAGYLIGDLARNLVTQSNANLPNQWVSEQGLQSWSTSWTKNGQAQFRRDVSAALERKIKANPNSPLKAFARYFDRIPVWTKNINSINLDRIPLWKTAIACPPI